MCSRGIAGIPAPVVACEGVRKSTRPPQRCVQPDDVQAVPDQQTSLKRLCMRNLGSGGRGGQHTHGFSLPSHVASRRSQFNYHTLNPAVRSKCYINLYICIYMYKLNDQSMMDLQKERQAQAGWIWCTNRCRGVLITLGPDSPQKGGQIAVGFSRPQRSYTTHSIHFQVTVSVTPIT